MNWQRTRLKYLTAEPIVNGLGESAALNDESWPRYIRTTDFAGPRALREETMATLPPALAHKAEVRRGDLLMSAAGTVGKTFLYDSDDPACYAGYLVRFRPAANVDPRFVAYWTETPLFFNQIETGKVTSTIDNFSASKYQNLSLSVPDLGTQQAIADYLDSETARIDALIAKKRRLTATVQERFQRTVHRDVEALVTQSGSTRLKRLAAISVGIVITPAAWYSDVAGVPALRGTNVRPRRLLVDDLVSLSDEGHLVNKKSELRAGDIVVVRTGQAGAAAVVPSTLDGCNCIDLLIVRQSPDLDPEFLSFVLNSEWVAKQIAEFSVGAIQSHFNVSALKELNFPLVPPQDQRKVAAGWKVLEDDSDAVTERLNRQIELLLEHRQALITAAVTGELEIPGVAA